MSRWFRFFVVTLALALPLTVRGAIAQDEAFSRDCSGSRGRLVSNRCRGEHALSLYA